MYLPNSEGFERRIVSPSGLQSYYTLLLPRSDLPDKPTISVVNQSCNEPERRFSVEFDFTASTYIQIAEEFRYEILIEALDEGDQVMSTTRYATAYCINPATTARAFTTLIDEDLSVKKRGIGMSVTAGTYECPRTTGRTRFIQGSLLPVVEEALTLGLVPNDLIDAIYTHAQNAETHTKEHW